MFSWVQVKRKSAVEMLEESKAFYVKSERVLDSKQELPHSDRFQVRSPMPGLPVRCRDPAGLGHITPHLSRSISYKEVNQSAREVLPPPRRQYTVKGAGESHEKHQLAIRKHFPIPLSMAAVKRFLSRPEEASQVKRVSPVPTHPYVKQTASFLAKKNPPLVNAGALFVNANCKKRPPPPPSSSQRFSFADPVPCTCQQQSNRAPPELPHRMNHRLITPPPLPPKSPGLRLRQASQPVTRPEKQQYPVSSKSSRLEATKKPTRWSRDYQEHPIAAAPRLSSAFLHKSLPDLNPASKTHKSNRAKLRAASTEVSCSECGSSDLSPSSSSSAAPSSSESSAGSKMVIRRKSRYAAGDRATSDYASRSPSFKYETGSLLHTTRVYWYSQAGGDDPRSKKRPIIRSKSDVGHNAFQNPDPPVEFATNGVPFELNHFFESCGVGCNVELPDTTSGRSTPVYFSSVSSVDSADRRPITEVDADELAAALQRRLLGSQPGLGEPSIVERNARIIKWIINCRKAAAAAAESMAVKKTTRNLNRSFKDKQQCTQTSYYGQSTRL